MYRLFSISILLVLFSCDNNPKTAGEAYLEELKNVRLLENQYYEWESMSFKPIPLTEQERDNMRYGKFKEGDKEIFETSNEKLGNDITSVYDRVIAYQINFNDNKKAITQFINLQNRLAKLDSLRIVTQEEELMERNEKKDQ